MLKTPKLELAVAFWPEKSQSWMKLGCENYPDSGMSCDSFALSLRPVDRQGYTPGPMIDAARHLGINVWLSSRGDLGHIWSFDVRGYDIHFMELEEAEAIVRMLRRAKNKLANLKLIGATGSTVAGRFELELRQVLDALGIRQSVRYSSSIGSHPTYFNLDDVINAAVAEFQRRAARCDLNLKRRAA